MASFFEQKEDMWLREGRLDIRKISSALILIAMMAIMYIVSYKGNLSIKETQFEELRQTEQVEAFLVENTEQETETVSALYDFEELQATNGDIYAWITVPGTQVDYPVLQSETDNYYLDHNLDHSMGYPGCIYSNSCNAKDFSDYNTVIYGHNMKNGSMFGSLHEFEDADFFAENRWIYVYTPEKRLGYEIYAAVKFSDIYISYYYDVKDITARDAFLRDVVAACEASEISHVVEEAKPTGDEGVLVLSTCIKGEDDKRYLLVGVQKEEVFYEESK